MSTRLRWGILGTGNIARQFTLGVKTSETGEIVAVGSRSADSAAAFAKQHDIAATHASYDALIADRGVDAIYLSLPNSMHHEWTLKALRASKHVLCEKPFAMDVAQSQEMFDVATKAGRVVIEAFMYRAHPQTAAVVDAVRGGEIGRLKLIRSSFCYRTSKIDGNVRFDRALGGGALMDVGCYCISLSRLLAGSDPTAVHAVATMHERGVDESCAAVLRYGNDVHATFSIGMSTQADNTVQICGDGGYLHVEWPWKPQPGRCGYTIAQSIPPKQDGTGVKPAAPMGPRRVDVECRGELYAIEADAFAATVLDGADPFVSSSETLANMRTLDEIRRQIGLSWD